jgi:hypothetical protein
LALSITYRSKIKLKIERMIVYGYAALRQFPKSEKHTLAADIRQCMYRLLRQVIVTNRRYHKKTTAQEIDAELDLLRSLVRIAKDLGFLHYPQYKIWAGHLFVASPCKPRQRRGLCALGYL